MPWIMPRRRFKVAHDVAHVVFRGLDFDFMIGSSSTGSAFMKPDGSHGTCHFEGQFVGVDVVVGAVKQHVAFTPTIG
jgi:hypothetical protein